MGSLMDSVEAFARSVCEMRAFLASLDHHGSDDTLATAPEPGLQDAFGRVRDLYDQFAFHEISLSPGQGSVVQTVTFSWDDLLGYRAWHVFEFQPTERLWIGNATMHAKPVNRAFQSTRFSTWFASRLSHVSQVTVSANLDSAKVIDGEIKDALAMLIGTKAEQSSLVDYLIFHRPHLSDQTADNTAADESGMSGTYMYEKSNTILDTENLYLLSRLARSEQDIATRDRFLTRSTTLSSGRIETAYHHIYGAPQGGGMLDTFGKKVALPANSVRYERSTYEEIVIPAILPDHNTENNTTVSIDQLESCFLPCFSNYKTFNRVQSIVFSTAYCTNENMLICAPTGAGKTDIGLLAIFRTILSNSNDDNGHLNILRDRIKIIYIAPMKALAAEIVSKLQRRLKHLTIIVRELTGDMQLSRDEIEETQIIVTTPEKWDVVTRKGAAGGDLIRKVQLLILDEVHMLHDERGAVIESLVARTLRQIESSQSMIRIVGLSATLPNYVDVADFLRVNRNVGLFYFGDMFRPVPLERHFIGVKGKTGTKVSFANLDTTAFEKVLELVKDNRQVMVFVHSRKETVQTAEKFHEMATAEGVSDCFSSQNHPSYEKTKGEISHAKSKELKRLFDMGFGIHHAGLVRSDRNIIERLFGIGLIKVLCCTATLAWGVNLPAYAVIIKGTQIHDPKKGGYVDLGILDVQQIFGRAGRPGLEKRGAGYICTTHDRLAHYLTILTEQRPIESRFTEKMIDNLNAEISLGSVTNVDEGVQWLSYTYLFVRMRKNPLKYGISHSELQEDPTLANRRRDLIVAAAKRLNELQMIVFNAETEQLTAKDLGRTASNFYLLHNTIEMVNTLMQPEMPFENILMMVSNCAEFSDLKVRQSESHHLERLVRSMPYPVGSIITTAPAKVNILLQCYVEGHEINDFGLVNEMNFVADNSLRICTALFTIALSRTWGPVALSLISLKLAIETRVWPFCHPLSDARFGLPKDIVRKLNAQQWQTSIDDMLNISANELGDLVHNYRCEKIIRRSCNQFPRLELVVKLAPLTQDVLQINIVIIANFQWSNKLHAPFEPFWIWVENSESTEVLHSERILITRRKIRQPQILECIVPLVQPLPSQIFIRTISEKWQGSEVLTPVSFQHLIAPELKTRKTPLLDLQPLPISVLNDSILENIYSSSFSFFNPIQTQIFHTVYHQTDNVLLGAPTGSGKTIAAELAMWCAFRRQPSSKVVYIAPMKALVRERVNSWGKRLMKEKNLYLIEVTGDATPESRDMQNANVIITTPEKWDGITRIWRFRKYVQQVSLIIMDEIHMLAGDRGPVLEVIVSRLNYISSLKNRNVRVLGLSTALANARDLASWLNVPDKNVYNFSHNVRPVPLEIYIDGFPSNGGYCPRMNAMNKPVMNAIKTHSPDKPVLVFVSSRRQTRLTAQDLINFCGMEDNPRRFLNLSESQLSSTLSKIHDASLKSTINFGIGLHHAGLSDNDRHICEELFLTNSIQVLVATSTLAWGVNLPAHLVVVKGAEYYDAKAGGYRDMDLTDVLQMLGRAGRPGFDNSGVARVFVKDIKKSFYKHFLHTGFPVESALHKNLTDHVNAEIAANTIKIFQDGINYLTSTFLFRRLHQNPTYYGLKETDSESINTYLSNLLFETFEDLHIAGCIVIDRKECRISPTPLGKISSLYYISHKTVKHLVSSIRSNITINEALQLLAEAVEFDELPVRHNEDIINMELAKSVPFEMEQMCLPAGDPHVKCFLLLQAHIEHLELPIADYANDTLTVIDASMRLLQAYIDVTAELGILSSTKIFILLLQSIKQASWPTKNLLKIYSMHFNISIPKHIYDIRSMSVKDALPLIPPAQVKLSNLRLNFPDLTSRMGEDNVVYLRRQNKPLDASYRVFTPCFAKPQYEGWFVISGSKLQDKLLALKRVSMRKYHTEFAVRFPDKKEKVEGPETINVMSDGWMGADIEVDTHRAVV